LIGDAEGVFGVDIDNTVISQAQPLFNKNNWEFERRLNLIGRNNKTNFPNEYFDFVFSDQVIEHVQDIRGLVDELNRITKKDGRQIHRWPSKFKIIEPHLYMPLIHWLPKGFLRYFGILVYTACGIEPHWSELDGQSVWSKARTYTKYSHQKTYYRHLYAINRLFNASWKIEYFPKYKKIRKLFYLQFKTVILKICKLDQ
jgi:ubiquinone/menaquinone biosynthesis C-methylase UbiE